MDLSHSRAGRTRWAASRLALSLALCLGLTTPAVGAEDDPEAPDLAGAATVVESLHSTLISVMKDADRLGYQGRLDRLLPVLRSHFDSDWMAEKSVGRHWRKLDEAQQSTLVETIRKFTGANYAGRFDGWSGQSFETVKEEPSLHKTVLVYTKLTEPDDEGVELNYRLHRSDGTWRIIDVYFNGTVSELALRRSEYSSLIKRDGFDALLTALDDKIAKLAAGEISS